MREYYKILGVSEDASQEEIDIAYRTLKEKYSRERFYEGEIGNEAAKNLTKLETAYSEIISVKKKVEGENVVNDYSEVERLIKNGNISQAQQKLDDFSDRNAEWHYLQSVLFYKKNWINESKKQLEIALNMEPYNQKYSNAYSKLKEKIEFNDKQFRSHNGYNQQPNQQTQQQMGGTDSNGCIEFCGTWCCMNLLCNMCCNCR